MPKGLRNIEFSVDGDGLTRFGGLSLFQLAQSFTHISSCRFVSHPCICHSRRTWPDREYPILTAQRSSPGPLRSIRISPSRHVTDISFKHDPTIFTVLSKGSRPPSRMGVNRSLWPLQRYDRSRYNQPAHLWPSNARRRGGLCPALFSSKMLQRSIVDRSQDRIEPGRRIASRQHTGHGRCRVLCFSRAQKPAFPDCLFAHKVSGGCRILRPPSDRTSRRKKYRIRDGRPRYDTLTRALSQWQKPHHFIVVRKLKSLLEPQSLSHDQNAIAETFGQQDVFRPPALDVRPYSFIQTFMLTCAVSPLARLHHQKRIVADSSAVIANRQQKSSQIAQTFPAERYLCPCAEGHKKSQSFGVKSAYLQTHLN